MRWLDGILLGATQWLCDRTQQLTGVVTKFKFQKWSNILFTTFLLCAWGGACVFSEIDAVFLIGGLSVLLNVKMTISDVREIENQEKRFLARGEIKYHLLNNFSYRITLLMIGITLITMVLLAVTYLSSKMDWIRYTSSVVAAMSVLCFVMWGYFTPCVPRPPCKSKVRQWCEKALEWFRDLREPVPITEPGS